MWSRVLLWFAATVVCVGAQDDGGPIFFPDDEGLETAQTTTVRSKVKPQSTSKSLQMCREYAKSVRIKVDGFVGVISINTCSRTEPLIVNGTIAQPREFPHMALIGIRTILGIKWTCGGSLISERFVLSAAHCNPKKPVRVRLGDYNIQSTEDDENKDAKSAEFNIIQIIPHPEYDGQKEYNDITLYKLERNVVFNEYIRPICLHTEYELPKGYGIISGWGRTEFSGRPSSVLLKGNVTYVSGQECSKALNPSLQGKQAEIKDYMMICAGNFVNGTDTCQGDSGGPLQYELADPYCMYSQVGITSFGIGGCGFFFDKVIPAVYTRVSNYVPWIESIVWP